MNTLPQGLSSTRLPAIVLISAGVVGALVMTLHPTAQGMGATARLNSLTMISALAMHVHMAMIASVVSLWLALAYIAKCFPLSGWIWLAVRLYSIGTAAMLGAALVSGFITGDYLGRVLPKLSAAEDALPPILLAFSTNQVLSGFGTIFMSAAIAAWSMALVRTHGPLARGCGIYGIISGLACIVAYATGFLSFDVVGMTAVVVAHGAWYSLLGTWLLRRRVGFKPA